MIANLIYFSGISYSFMGRQFEKMDPGYSAYSGFLHMEASNKIRFIVKLNVSLKKSFYFSIKVHTNPILITFCSILYYEDLNEYLHRFQVERRGLMSSEPAIRADEIVEMKSFGRRRLSVHDEPRKYRRLVLNRWHLWLRLSLNKEIIYMRQNNLRKKRDGNQISVGMIARMKLKVQNLRIKKHSSVYV